MPVVLLGTQGWDKGSHKYSNIDSTSDVAFRNGADALQAEQVGSHNNLCTMLEVSNMRG